MELLERIVSRTNMRRAYEQVILNKGSGGVDGIELPDFKTQVEREWPSIRQKIREGSYEPKPIRRVEIPKSDGGKRMLGIPTLMDRMIQQAIGQVLMEEYDSGFSNNSYGFRPGRNAHQAVLRARQYVNEGCSHIVDIDLERFFDRVNHDYLMNLLSGRIKGKPVLRLIHRYLRIGVMEGGVATVNREGTPQGGPIAPRTHSQTFCFRGDFRSREEDFDNIIKGSIFMTNGKGAELGTSPADQPGVCLVVKGETYARDSRAINREVWSFPDTGLPVYTASQRKRWESSYSGDGCGIYGETAAEPDQSGKEVCPISGDVDQQSGAGSAGRVPVKAGSWQKRRDKLKCRIATTGCGSKSSLRLTISLYQRPTTALSLPSGVMLN